MTTSFTRLGLPAEFGASWLLPRLVGVGNAMDLLLSGRVIDAQEALDLGLVNRGIRPRSCSAALAFTRGSRRELLAGRDGGGQGTGRSRLAPHAGESLAEATAMVAAPERRADFREGVDSYVEKRPPNFRPLPRRGRGVDVTLDGRVAMVTGAARGIGAAIAGRLAGLGASVAVCDIDDEGASETAKALETPSISVGLDVSDRAAVVAAVTHVGDDLGPIDILVNNAGIDIIEPFMDSTEETWDRLWTGESQGPDRVLPRRSSART